MTYQADWQSMWLYFFQPENILLCDNLSIKLSDFGFATIISHEEELGGKYCTLHI